jgi:hypothetical protein
MLPRSFGKPLVLHLVALLVAGAACGDVPIDDERNDNRLFPPRGVIRGTVTYVGPPPCSRGGHIVGSAVVLVFDRRNPPPPNGLATEAVNFVSVPGDVLFANVPRSVGEELFCPPETTTIEASAPFAVAPVDAGSYVVSSFYDRRGRFWPTFKFRNLPEAGDLGGGYIDVEDARRNAGNLAYTPIYRPVEVGIRQPGPADEIPDYTIGDNGYVADNIPVSIGRVIPFTRPYFHPRHIDPITKVETSAEQIGDPLRSPANATADPLAVPILAMTQDVHVLAPPTNPTPQTLAAYQDGFQSLKLVWSVAKNEFDAATDETKSFGFQLPALPPAGKGGLLVFARGGAIPENPTVPALWPQVALVKLADDPERKTDRQSLVIQGTREETLVTGKAPGPLVVIQGITLLDDSLARTIAGPVPAVPTTASLRDHLTALVRPAAVCFDPKRVDLGGLLVTPHLTGRSADGSEAGDKPLFDAKAIAAQPQVREVRRGCLPMGRYAISLVYPTGQAWTVPNESGGCSAQEGTVRVGERTGSCTDKPRPVLLSQGSRGVVEIIGPSEAGICDEHPVPSECLPPR